MHVPYASNPVFSSVLPLVVLLFYSMAKDFIFFLTVYILFKIGDKAKENLCFTIFNPSVLM